LGATKHDDARLSSASQKTSKERVVADHGRFRRRLAFYRREKTLIEVKVNAFGTRNLIFDPASSFYDTKLSKNLISFLVSWLLFFLKHCFLPVSSLF
jgi:hypothetical protein